MKQITDIDQGTIRRVDWQELIPPTIFFRAFSATFKVSFLCLGSALAACAAYALGFAPASCESNSMCGLDLIFAPFRYSYNAIGDYRFILIVAAAAVVAAWFALALSRTTVVRLTSSSRSSTLASGVFAAKKFRSIVPSALLPVVCAFAIYIGSIVVDKSGAFGEICAPIVVLALFALVSLTAIFTLALPLSVSAVAAENSDCFDAISRGISYITQRFLFGTLYSFFAIVLTIVGLAFVQAVAHVCYYAFEQLYYQATSGWLQFWRLTIMIAPIVYCCVSVVVYSNAIYILLRRSVDGTPFDSCVLDLSGRKPRQLRQILVDGKGAPEFDKTVAEASKQEESEKSAFGSEEKKDE